MNEGKEMTNKLKNDMKLNSFAAALCQLDIQATQQEMMQREINNIKCKLEQASKTLAQKDLLIDSLELDLEHMIDQMVRLQHTRQQCEPTQQWMSRSVPGLNVESNHHSVA